MNIMESRNKLLYPLMVTAAIAVTLFSALGIATMAGYLPGARSAEKPAATAPAGASPNKAETGDRAAKAACVNCGVVESIRVVEHRGSGTGLGAVAGALTGLLVGNQLGSGNGRTAMTVLGGVGGAYAGNEIEKNTKRTTSYEVRVHLDNGGVRTLYTASSPQVAIGDKVRVTNGTVVPQG